jgi:hypothetical protein
MTGAISFFNIHWGVSLKVKDAILEITEIISQIIVILVTYKNNDFRMQNVIILAIDQNIGILCFWNLGTCWNNEMYFYKKICKTS